MADRGVAHDAEDNEPSGQEPPRPARRGQDGTRRAQDGTRQAGESTRRPPSRRRAPELTASGAAQAGLRQIAELTGKKPEGVTGVDRADDGWVVSVEVVEDRRIPSSADILATYQAEVDMNGQLLSYRRVRRYSRGQGDSRDS